MIIFYRTAEVVLLLRIYIITILKQGVILKMPLQKIIVGLTPDFSLVTADTINNYQNHFSGLSNRKI